MRAPGFATRWISIADVANARLDRIKLKPAGRITITVHRKRLKWNGIVNVERERPSPVFPDSSTIEEIGLAVKDGRYEGWLDPGPTRFVIRDDMWEELARARATIVPGKTAKVTLELD